jgi:hypothetical protein
MKCWTGHKQRGRGTGLQPAHLVTNSSTDGYVSFPDFEYFTDYSSYEAEETQREGIKT